MKLSDLHQKIQSLQNNIDTYAYSTKNEQTIHRNLLKQLERFLKSHSNSDLDITPAQFAAFAKEQGIAISLKSQSLTSKDPFITFLREWQILDTIQLDPSLVSNKYGKILASLSKSSVDLSDYLKPDNLADKLAGLNTNYSYVLAPVVRSADPEASNENCNNNSPKPTK